MLVIWKSTSPTIWSPDISNIPMERGYMYLLAIMDVYSRCIPGWSLSDTMEAEWVVNTLRMTVNKYGRPEIISPDQGSQFTPDEYIDYIKSLETVRIIIFDKKIVMIY
ncbi:MAG: transposase family protein [Bacteroidales bacterium]|nr:transposase family protein [Bacteroidales bacterium]